MRKRYLLAGALMVAALGAGIVGISGVLADEEVSLQEVPDAVRATIEKHAGQGEIVEVEREIEDGQVVYEAEVVVDGKELELMISAAGQLLSTGAEEEDDDEDEDGEDEDEESVTREQLPRAVQDALSKALPDAQIGELTREAEDGFVVYEAGYEANGAEHEAKLTEGGQIIETEERIAPSALPPAVMVRIQASFPDAEIEEAELVTATFYEIELEAGGKEHEIKIFANGQVIEDDED